MSGNNSRTDGEAWELFILAGGEDRKQDRMPEKVSKAKLQKVTDVIHGS